MVAERRLETSDLGQAELVVALQHLTGPSRGTVSWLWQPAVEVRLAVNGRICLCAA